MTRRLPSWGFAAAFALQAGLLAWMVADRALLLANGKEIRLPVIPVDPRDLIRGYYVILSYPISTVLLDQRDAEGDFRIYDPVYVSLRKDGDSWSVAGVHQELPKGEIVLKGRLIGADDDVSGCSAPPCRFYRIEYGIEQFFIPEGHGHALEELRNDQRVAVDVAVSSGGRAALKRLLVDGEVRYAESLF
jgi:uncharacterized membrane-anchored protein